MEFIGAIFAALDRVTRTISDGFRNVARSFVDGPLQGFVFALIVGFTGLLILIEDALSLADRVASAIERGLVFFAMMGMTFLAFNEYTRREFTTFSVDIDGGMNFALLLMVVVGFLGASLATQQEKHIAIDAIDRVLSAGPARQVRRITSLVAAGLSYMLMKGSWHYALEHSHDAFEGVKVWSWMVAPINWAVGLIPGEKYGCGPGGEEACLTAMPEMADWEDAQFDAGIDFTDFPVAFAYVAEGDKFPLWLAVMVLVMAFGFMSARFGARVFSPKAAENPRVTTTGTRRPADVILAGVFPGALLAMGAGAYFGTPMMIVFGSILLVFLGSPLFVAIGVGTVASWLLIRNGSTESVVADMFEATKKQELLAIPFFVLAGNLMTRGSISQRLIDFARALLGHLPGGLGVGAVLSCALFAAISGSSPVTVIAIGSLLFPMLVKDGYSESYSMGVLTTAGGLGIIIPPSIPMIVYAIVVGGMPGISPEVVGENGHPDLGTIGVDPATLFKAGILPGFFIAFMLILYTFYVTWPRGDVGMKRVTEPFQAGPYAMSVATALRKGILSLMLPVLILGGIYGVLQIPGTDIGIRFTVTEAAAVSVVYALFVELIVHRELKWKDLPDVVTESAVMMGSLFLILVIAISLNRFLSFQQVPEAATEWMLARVDSKITFLIMVNLFLLALGCVMDILSAILIVAPLLAPIAAQYGIHPVHFGIMFIVNLELGYLTPPMGINLFVASTVFERSILDVIKAVVPFLLVMLVCLFGIVWFEGLSMALLR
ncbi:MAG: TRAP transporter large permease subunit [Proteobacteria bacterium]|nr:TRAP transporter large permease subunit [Pseudomonadota bacterium]